MGLIGRQAPIFWYRFKLEDLIFIQNSLLFSPSRILARIELKVSGLRYLLAGAQVIEYAYNQVGSDQDSISELCQRDFL